jgi:hypothetical protein
MKEEMVGRSARELWSAVASDPSETEFRAGASAWMADSCPRSE